MKFVCSLQVVMKGAMLRGIERGGIGRGGIGRDDCNERGNVERRGVLVGTTVPLKFVSF